jgi:DNA repair exonuclease SbcCD ATPase subunit
VINYRRTLKSGKPSKAERKRQRREMAERHLVDYEGQAGVALCGRKVPYPALNFLPASKGLCPVCQEMLEGLSRLVELREKEGTDATVLEKSVKDYAEAERRKLHVRPAGLHEGIIDAQESRRFPSVKRCGGGWQR